MSLGKILRKKREALSMTLEEVSRRTGFSKPYLSTIETEKVPNPPGDELLTKLETILKFEPGLLLHIAHMEKLPADVRQSYESAQAESSYWRALIQQVVQGNGDLSQLLQAKEAQNYMEPDPSNTQAVNTAGKLVPVINKVPAGYPVDFDDLGYPPGSADDYVRCPDLHDPNAFAVCVVGDSMEPKYKEGDIIVFSPAAGVENGDDCFIRMTDPHETTFKQIFFDEHEAIRLQPRNQKYSPIVMDKNRINGLYKAIIRYEHLNV
jgi:repressor LexA